MTKTQIIQALQPHPQNAPEEAAEPEPQILPEVEGKIYVYDPRNNAYVLIEAPKEVPTSRRYFDQKATLYTDELSHAPIARAYNLEHTIPITDKYEEIGARDRGQEIGDASGNAHTFDEPPEGGTDY